MFINALAKLKKVDRPIPTNRGVITLSKILNNAIKMQAVAQGGRLKVNFS